MKVATLLKSALDWLGGRGMPHDPADEFAHRLTILAFRRAEIAMDTLGAGCGRAPRFACDRGGAR
ncbi:MAG: hypothetical protein ABSG83_20015 [Roseiarcus sp.]|jgi:hypothetical protein